MVLFGCKSLDLVCMFTVYKKEYDSYSVKLDGNTLKSAKQHCKPLLFHLKFNMQDYCEQ